MPARVSSGLRAPAAPRPAQTELPAGRRRSSGQSPGGFLLPSPAPRPSARPKSPGSGATSAGTPSLASCPLPGLLCSPSSPSIQLGWAPESGLPVELLLGLADGQDGLVQGPQPPCLLPTPRARALTAWDGQQPVQRPGHEGTQDGRDGRSEDERGCPGSRCVGPWGHAQLTGSPAGLTRGKDAIVLIRQLRAGLRSGAAALGGLAVAGGLVAGLAEPPVWPRPLERDGAAAARSPPTPPRPRLAWSSS